VTHGIQFFGANEKSHKYRKLIQSEISLSSAEDGLGSLHIAQETHAFFTYFSNIIQHQLNVYRYIMKARTRNIKIASLFSLLSLSHSNNN